MTTTVDATRLEVLACPACGNDGRRGVLLYVAGRVATAHVVAVRRGVLEISGPPVRQWDDPPMRPRIECHGRGDNGRVCGHKFELPTAVSALTWKVPS